MQYAEADYADLIIYTDSVYLQLEKRIDLFFPYDYHPELACGLLIVNDGQDAPALQLRETLYQLTRQKIIQPIIIAAVHATERLQEYGTAHVPDYAKRGSKAHLYTAFLIEELIPLLEQRFNLTPRPTSRGIFGCSLGGLSAFDIAWHHAWLFERVGVCSGAFWWRRHSANDNFANFDRIIHSLVRNGYHKEGLQFWFEAGTADETEDRNGNGIIDAIDDTLDLIAELYYKGYNLLTDVRYVEIQGGQHNQHTWAKAFPDFLTWAFGNK
ncbi:MAG: alpha/beta hydrolase-fold protein [Cytophagales bacterium]|nr:alpha/beta hydrolase-fold protein [Bernardetiaceae bacterium]MDW8209952.1 alpha/beta hydrolase-fold protein [Cytophagales bacterium]